MNRIMMNFIKVTSLVCFLDLNYFNFGFDGQHLVRELGAKFCPYTNFCSLEASKQIIDVTLTPCCRPCFCDDDCWELDNCCPDKEAITEASSDLISCKSTKVKLPRLDKRDTLIFGSEYFRVIDTCPSTEENLTLIGLCKGGNKDVFEDYIWVSDYRDGRIYQNLHCAKCHKIDSYVSWQVKTTCKDILHTDFVNVKKMLLQSDSCDIINLVPDNQEAMAVKYECFENRLAADTTCNEAQHEQLGNLSQDIVAACKHSTWPYMRNYHADRNVFCFICNNGLETEMKDLCERSTHSKKDFPGRFSAIINYREKPVEHERKEHCGCHRNEVLDKYMGRCHKLICPFGRVPLFGRCELMLSNINSLFIDIFFYLETLWPHTNLDTLNNNAVVGRAIHLKFLQYLGWEKAGCGSRKTYVKVADKNALSAGFLVQYNLRTTLRCQPAFIQQQAWDILGKMITVNITGDILVVLVHPGKWIEDEPTKMSQIFFSPGFDRSPADTTSVILDAEMPCPKIEISLSYVESLSALQKKEKLMFLSFFETADIRSDSDTIYVCQEHYFAVMSLTNACLCLNFLEANFFTGFLIVYILF